MQSESSRTDRAPDNRFKVITALGITQIFSFGGTYYLPAILTKPINADTGWSAMGIVGGLSVGMLTAGLISRRIGGFIQQKGGRSVLAGSSILLCVGLVALGLAPTLPFYLAAWIVIGFGMGSGLYDAVFSTLGKLYGSKARTAITTLTLYGGFASTICWPFSAYLNDMLGWRGTCFAYALIQLVVCLPAHWFLVPSQGSESTANVAQSVVALPEKPESYHRQQKLFLIMATALTISGIASSIVAVHLLVFFQSRGADLGTAVFLGTLLGPSQVAARLVEMLFGTRYHPIWTLVAATTFVAIGCLLFFTHMPLLIVAIVIYGAGNGIWSIARGTVPLVLFGPTHYAAWMGRLATPSLLAQALSPFIATSLMDFSGPVPILAFVTTCACLNVLLALTLFRASYGTSR